MDSITDAAVEYVMSAFLCAAILYVYFIPRENCIFVKVL